MVSFSTINILKTWILLTIFLFIILYHLILCNSVFVNDEGISENYNKLVFEEDEMVTVCKQNAIIYGQAYELIVLSK